MKKIPFVNECSLDCSSVIVFGGGYYGKIVCCLLEHMGIEVEACFDNNINVSKDPVWKKWGICQKPYLSDSSTPIIVAVVNPKAVVKINNQLADLGYEHVYYIDKKGIDTHMDGLSDQEFLEIQYYCASGKTLKTDNPRTFNEKLQWLKLNDRNPWYTTLADKYLVKDYIRKTIGSEYVIETYGVWDHFDEIDFDTLPERFVLKCNHDSGSTIVIDEKSLVDYSKIKAHFEYALKYDYYLHGREWCYKNIKHKILAERCISIKNDIKDYKFMCFNGVVKCLFVCTNRYSKTGLNVTFFNREWERLPFTRAYPADPSVIKRPNNLDHMICIAEKLSEKIPFVRIDLFEQNDRIYFGEYTFYPGNGIEFFEPDMWDEVLGSWINLPKSDYVV